MTQTLMIAGSPVPVFPGEILPHWIEAARAKGYELVARISDRLHVALRCSQCGALIRVRIYTLMSAHPLCPACVQAGWITTAQAAGLTYLGRCSEDRHYAIYRAQCGHLVRRQFELVERSAAGKTRIRCEVCHNDYEKQEAAKEGWTLLGSDPEGNISYRSYQHDACGHIQRLARANIQTGRVSCGSCGDQWPAAPSHLYAMRFVLPNSHELVKLGYSNNPHSRLHHQLIKDPDLPCAILRTVPVASGQVAIQTEKALHRKLRREHPEAVVDPKIYRDALRVKSEIYDADLTPMIVAELDKIAARNSPTVS
ncbi:GIY-YIG nuclease family protein [Marivita sp. GX14005]|uniref:GIY-YIG nuclease family protein n=1 Tax=Marivita sp. GX14005 TaxID=2942276 RepID=UPI002019F372|nr:GIY-YIG nuclease family protein [Marivita sp. GX14005]MCL3881914.1 GIY-YIG nuclease family protein [Marivita sp. GX14005]